MLLDYNDEEMQAGFEINLKAKLAPRRSRQN